MLQLFLFLFGFDVTTKIVRGTLQLENPAILFAILITVALFTLARNNFTLSRTVVKTNLFVFFISFLFIGVTWLFVGILNGNDIHHAINDSSSFLIYSASGFVLSLYLFGRPSKNKHKLLKNLLLLGALLASLELIISMIWMLDTDPEHHLLTQFMDNSHINRLPDYTQAFSINMLVFVPLFFLFWCLSIRSSSLLKKLALYIAQGLVLVAITLCYVRMFWVAIFLGILGYLVLLRKWKLLLSLIGIVCVFIFSDLQSNQLNSTNFVSRLTSIQDTNDSSNAMKLLQVGYLIDSIMENPLIGKGFGLHLNSFVRDDSAPYAYEVDLVALIAKIGLVGISIIILMLMKVLLHFLVILKYFLRHKFEFEAFATFLGLFCVFYILLIDLTNPYLVSPLGTFFFFYAIAILDLLDRIQIDLASASNE